MIDDSVHSYLNKIADRPILSDQQVAALQQQFRRGTPAERQRAYTSLVESHLRYVASIVLRELRPAGSLCMADMIQEANIALMQSFEHWDAIPEARLNFIKTCIKRHIYRVLDNEMRTIRLSLRAIKELSLLAKAERAWRKDFDADPTIEDLAAVTGLSEARIRLITERAQAPLSLDVEEITNAIQANAFIDRAPDPAQALDLDELQRRLAETISTLNELERVIIAARFGLGEADAQNAPQLAARFGISSAAIKEIEQRAVQRLRHPDRARPLKEYAFAN